MSGFIINSNDWNLRTAAEGGLKSTADNGPGVQDPAETVQIRSHLLRDADPFVTILKEPPHHYASVHYHTEPEIMIVLEGKMLINGEWCYPGAIIYYDANDHYWHATGAEPCVTALIRPGKRGLVWMGPKPENTEPATGGQSRQSETNA